MTSPQSDRRSDARQQQDEQIAAEGQLAPIVLPEDAAPSPMESHLRHHQKPLAVPGIVENGLVRPLDPSVELSEHARVIIVASVDA